ncbi:nuclease [Rubrobacter marinus]|uniref:Nuclease n=1 Tax=Rubrobacter marinus TaxID=2653852 RepID=A0A6G8PYE5_9ACTN|nr:nuclease [Rubrobacter marinus]QIN79220.1 nuclease [Rubrobacter marinus]
MPFSVIEGTFHVVGYSPDGDSVRFRARDEADWRKLSGPPVVLNAREHAQLRFEAIDTLETHYLNSHQPLALATAALEFLLADLGITDVEWNEARTEVTSATDGTGGYILSRATEGNRRPVAFVYAGEPPQGEEGSDVFLDVEKLRESVNYRSLERGLAYPTYYKGLFPDLREAMSAAVVRAREEGLGVWAEDRTNAGFAVEGPGSLSEEHVILPKLFRRLAEYLQAGGPVAGFDAFLEARAEEIIVIPNVHATHLDTVVEVEGETVRMTERPEDLIFEG